ncbi:Laminin subunit alpha-1 [Penaeus vannamei]|uniref:Laminin subunit alpha-1 n=1 Tax=Penaeus vannamei TaxID=6689 RepID=A0A3R7MLL1_PENVA|nr:Laminin subunit alpha-1 [Penaeus vannamei]
MMMIALQNIQHILIRATHAADATTASLHDVTMDIAAEGSPVSSRVALGVEQCFCPKSYSGTSCQNPNIGFYRWYKQNHIQSTIIIDLVGESRPCRCNGRSEACDSETGVCKNCRDNTWAPTARSAPRGTTATPRKAPASPAPARRGSRTSPKRVRLIALPSTSAIVASVHGDKCDRCDFGYYGRPAEPGGSCQPCNCDPFGSVHEGCDADGRCTCKPGITGRDCSQCAPRHVTSEAGCISCEDGCVNILLDEVEDMISSVTSIDVDGYIPAPWPSIRQIQNVTKLLRTQLTRYHSNVDGSQEMVINFDLDYYARDQLRRAEALEISARETYPPTAKIKSDAQFVLDLLRNVHDQLEETIAYLKNYAIGETPSISVGGALMEAEKILKEIQMRNFTQFDEDAEVELSKSRRLLDRVMKMVQKMPVLGALKDLVSEIRDKLNELRDRVKTSTGKVDEAAILNLDNRERLNRVKNFSLEIKNREQMLQRQNFNATRLTKGAEENLKLSIANYDDLIRMLVDLRNSSNFLEDFHVMLRKLNNEYRETYVKRAHDHAMELMRDAIRLQSLFNKTRDVADGPLRAAQAYQRIVDALLSAREAARNASHAAETAYTVAYPGDPENSLVRRASLSFDKSGGLRTKGEGLRATVGQQAVDLENQKEALKGTSSDLVKTDERLIALNAILDSQITSGISSPNFKRFLFLSLQAYPRPISRVQAVLCVWSDFMAVEMFNRKIEFIWDAGGGTKRIVHPLRLLTNDQQVTDDTKWYHISISRIGNIGQLTVLPANLPPGEEADSTPVSGASPAGFSKMDLLPTDTLWIGGAPPRAQNVMKAKKFAGCLHTVFIDGENIGLWNFTESEGCGACNEGEKLVLKQTNEIAVGFNGKGYFKGTNRIRRPKQYYSTVLAFKTLDEDALLFLAVNEAKNQYFSISLDDGHVVFTVQFDRQTRLIMKSGKKHNNNEMIQIQAIVQNKAMGGARMGRLVVGDQDQLGTVKGGPDLDLSYVPYYFGGVDPEFDRNRWGSELVLRSLLGCMGRLSVLDEGKNPLTDGQFYGIENTCAEKPLNEVGFLGQGFVELPSHVLKRESNFGFTFQTMESDALLMLSTFVGQPLEPGEVHPPDFYSVSLVEGHLDIQLNGGTGIERIMSAEKFNDGQLHSISVIKENRRVTLKVDDREVNSTRLDRGGQVLYGPNTGGLYFGGVPQGLDIVTMVGSSSPLKGCIRDVIVNNKVLPFNQPIQFQNVYIGRCADVPATAMQGMEGDMKVIDSCMPPTQHTVEYRALKFGDKLDSHVMIPLDRNTFKKDFNISFEFRTYYPNGLFFLASHTRKKQTQTLLAQLKNGRVTVTMKRRKKESEIVSGPGLNTGRWRKVIIRKAKKRLWLTVDNQLIKKVKAPRKFNVGQELFLGSVPSNVARPEDVQITETLRGCLRNLNINEEAFEIPSNRRADRIVGVGQCFASVQPGSYFPGDAYAVYSECRLGFLFGSCWGGGGEGVQ